MVQKTICLLSLIILLSSCSYDDTLSPSYANEVFETDVPVSEAHSDEKIFGSIDELYSSLLAAKSLSAKRSEEKGNILNNTELSQKQYFYVPHNLIDKYCIRLFL